MCIHGHRSDSNGTHNMSLDRQSRRHDEARKHIAALRREKFDLQGNSEAPVRVKNPLAEDLQHSIATLAKDIYTKKPHFIFELIQNAEDNFYAEGVKPHLSFRLLHDDPTRTPGSQGALIVENNEIGFTRKQVKALCSVDASTKKAQGFIGEKGIGFKSVFRVTSDPHVISNGYSFRLPENHEPTGLGFIVPCWLDHTPPDVNTSHTTC